MQPEQWDLQAQLTALLIEVVSIKVAGKGIKKPIDIDRPGKKKSARSRDETWGGRGESAAAQHDSQHAQQPESQPRALRPPVPPPSRGGEDPYKKGIAVLARTAKPRRG